MNEYSSPKRRKMSKDEDLRALNLSISADSRYDHDEPDSHNITPKTNDTTIDQTENLQEMRNKFQQWVLETYRDASKTKTITAKKYERIVKTVQGEIKNCAENSKFRFWMKCKGFKLECEGGVKTLYVLDKKGETIRYKRVAIVENFFDIIYNVHVNEGARGIQHAGQKRTHRSITETYAFLPREAVTKFLLCCVDCQKRTNEDRKTSPLVSSSSSHDSTCQNSKLDENSKHEEFSNTTYERPPLCEKIVQNYRNANLTETFNDEPITKIAQNVNHKTYESNNNIINKTEDCPTTPSTPIYQNNNLFKVEPNDDSINIQNIITHDYATYAYGMDRLRTRKRKRKFTRKIVRPNKTNVEPCDLTYSPFSCPTSTPFRLNTHNAEFIGQRTESSSDSITNEMQTSIKEAVELFPQKFPTDGIKLSFAANVPLLNAIESKAPECTNEMVVQDEKSNFTISPQSCPYFGKISEILFNPVKYAVTKKRKNSTCIPNEEEFLEQLAVDLVLKARELEAIKGKLTENEKQQISLKIYNSRVISFLLNYAADLMLKSLNHEI